MRHSLNRTLPLLALAGLGWLFWSAGRTGQTGPAGLLAQPRDTGAGTPGKAAGPSGPGKNKSRSGTSSDPRAANSGAPMTGYEPIRPAGPEAMQDPPRDWDEVDEESDESFPASDPPGRY